MAQQPVTNAQFSNLVKASQKTEEAHGLIQGIQTQLIGHTDDLRRGWGGASGMAFGTQDSGAFGAWNAELKNVLAELQKLSTKLHAVEKKYRQNEDDRVASTSRLTANINTGA